MVGKISKDDAEKNLARLEALTPQFVAQWASIGKQVLGDSRSIIIHRPPAGVVRAAAIPAGPPTLRPPMPAR